MVAAIGPVVFTSGFVWTLLALLLTPIDFYWREILFNPAHQLMVAGTLISLVCLPVAHEMLEATPADIAQPEFELQGGSAQPSPAHSRPRRYRGP